MRVIRAQSGAVATSCASAARCRRSPAKPHWRSCTSTMRHGLVFRDVLRRVLGKKPVPTLVAPGSSGERTYPEESLFHSYVVGGRCDVEHVARRAV